MVARHTTKFVHIVMCTTHKQDGFLPETDIVRVCKDEDAATRFSEKCQWGTPEYHATYFVRSHVVHDDE